MAALAASVTVSAGGADAGPDAPVARSPALVLLTFALAGGISLSGAV